MPQLPEDAKRTLRVEMQRRLAEIGAPGATGRSSRVRAYTLHLISSRPRPVVMLYLPIPGSAEVDVLPLVPEITRLDGQICFPRIDWHSQAMTPLRVDPASMRTEIRRHGVPEPADGVVIDPDELDFILIPGLAFDLRGGRLGRGGGFYDRFLAPFGPFADRKQDGGGPRPMLCGVCFEEQVVAAVPMFAQDVRMHALATDRRFVDFGVA